MENLIKMDDLGGPPLFLETPILIYIYEYIFIHVHTLVPTQGRTQLAVFILFEVSQAREPRHAFVAGANGRFVLVPKRPEGGCGMEMENDSM